VSPPPISTFSWRNAVNLMQQSVLPSFCDALWQHRLERSLCPQADNKKRRSITTPHLH
jgi:hypothetical protein